MLKNPRRSVVPEEDNPVAKSPNPVVAASGFGDTWKWQALQF